MALMINNLADIKPALFSNTEAHSDKAADEQNPLTYHTMAMNPCKVVSRVSSSARVQENNTTASSQMTRCTLQTTQSSTKTSRGTSHHRRLHFHDLPAEIRNRVYEYVYEAERTVAIRPRNAVSKIHPLSHLFIKKSSSPKAHRILSLRTEQAPGPNKILEYHKVPGSRPMPYTGVYYETSPISPLLACKSFSDEAAGYLYNSTEFFFEDPAHLDGFIKTVKPQNLLQIRKLKLFIQAYGIPRGKDDTKWENKQLSRWVTTLESVVEAMPKINILTLDIYYPNVTSFLGRAFRSTNSDLGPLALPLCLSKLTHLKKASVHTSSQSLTCASDRTVIADVYGPHFEVQGIYNPSPFQKEAVFVANKLQVEGLHDALDLAIKRMIGAGVHGEKGREVGISSQGDNDWYVPLKDVVREWQQWNRDPVGNALRAAGPLPAPVPVQNITPPANTSSPVVAGLPTPPNMDNVGYSAPFQAPLDASNPSPIPQLSKTRRKKVVKQTEWPSRTFGEFLCHATPVPTDQFAKRLIIKDMKRRKDEILVERNSGITGQSNMPAKSNMPDPTIEGNAASSPRGATKLSRSQKRRNSKKAAAAAAAAITPSPSTQSPARKEDRQGSVSSHKRSAQNKTARKHYTEPVNGKPGKHCKTQERIDYWQDKVYGRRNLPSQGEIGTDEKLDPGLLEYFL